MLIDTLRNINNVNLSDVIAQILAVLCIIFLILPFHELAHAWVAYKLGDHTAKWNGRLTFNPLASVDYMGALMLLLFGFGWAKAVPVDSRNFKKPRRDMALVALAGPMANVLAALVGALIFYTLAAFQMPVNTFTNFIRIFLSFYITVNISLAVFNLLPIPPLDGSKILGSFLPDRILDTFYRYQNVFTIILFVLIFSNILSIPLGIARTGLTNAILYIAQRPFVWLGLI